MSFLKSAGKATIIVAGVAVVVPYATAILANVLYGWPITQNKYSRALHPKKVLSLNIALFHQLAQIRYAGLALRWKHFYSTVGSEKATKDIPYGLNNNCLDIYLPAGSLATSATAAERRAVPAAYGPAAAAGLAAEARAGGPAAGGGAKGRPVVVFIYGGTWSSGDKSMYGMLCSHLADMLQAVVVCPNYSLYPKNLDSDVIQCKHSGFVDDMVQDISDVLSWVKQHAHSYSANQDKIILISHSAGAHLAALTTMELAVRRSFLIGQSMLTSNDLTDSSTVAAETQPLPIKMVSMESGRIPRADVFRPATAPRQTLSQLSYRASPVRVSDIRDDSMNLSVTGQQSFVVVPQQGQGSVPVQSETSVRSADQYDSFVYISEASAISELPSQTSTSLQSEASPEVKPEVKLEGTQAAEQSEKAAEDLNKTSEEQADVKQDDTGSSSVVKQEQSLSTAAEQAEIRDVATDLNLVVPGEESEGEYHEQNNGLNAIKLIIGLAGVYDISSHYNHETLRGVEDVSMMARAMYGPEHFHKFSPAVICRDISKQIRLPSFLLLHGDADITVPLSSSLRFGEILWGLNQGKPLKLSSPVEVAILPGCSHADICLDLMLPSRAWHDAVMGEIMKAVNKVV